MPRRQVVALPGAEHKAPIPAGVRIGGMFFSSAINGKDPTTGEYPASPADQARFAFDNMATLLRAAGGDVADVAHMTVFLQNRDDKKYVDEQWLAMFPDPADRPARHAVTVERSGKMLIQLEVVAVIDTPRSDQ
jgi:2-iminobutanoate/2-iminopropanoate deaminase